MRTTVELTEAQHRHLTDLAMRRGLRGFSPLVQEAIEQYLDGLGEDEAREAATADRDVGDVALGEIVHRHRQP